MIYAPKAQIHHYHQLSLASFWKQHFGYGKGAFCFHQLRSQRLAKQIEVEPLSFYLALLTYPFTEASKQSKLLLSSLLFLSQIANITGFLWENYRHTSLSNSFGRSRL